jgi:hypothetical protein
MKPALTLLTTPKLKLKTLYQQFLKLPKCLKFLNYLNLQKLWKFLNPLKRWKPVDRA